MNGKTVIVTGANTGIGLETAAGLAEKGARVVLTARDTKKGTAAVDEIKRRHPDADVDVMQLDLSSLANVRAFASDYGTRQLDVLINNAGLVLDKRTLTEDGIESTFQINHLGPFLLTNLLRPNLEAAAPSRIVNVASSAHRGSSVDFDDLQNEKGYRSMKAYGRSKLSNILFTRELARRLAGTRVTANSLHPGTVRTGFGRDGDVSGFFALGIKIIGPFIKTPAQGARTSIHVASAPELENVTGEFFVNRRIAKPSAAARDDDAARRLWEVSASLVGISA